MRAQGLGSVVWAGAALLGMAACAAAEAEPEVRRLQERGTKAAVLRMTGPAEVTVHDRPAEVTVVVKLPQERPSARLQIDWTGECAVTGTARSTFGHIPTEADTVEHTALLAVPDGMRECDAQVETQFVDHPSTRTGVTVRARAALR